MNKRFLNFIACVITCVVISLLSVVLLLPVLSFHNPPMSVRDEQMDGDPVEGIIRERLKKQKQAVWALVIEDIEKYGINVFRLFCEISQRGRGEPGRDFGADKSIRKLEVTYPQSNTYKLAVADMYYKAIGNRDILLIEKAISQITPGSDPSLLPNGLELEPLLYIAMYNYHMHSERFDSAQDALNTLREKYADSLIQYENNVIPVKNWLVQQKQIFEAIKKFHSKGTL